MQWNCSKAYPVRAQAVLSMLPAAVVVPLCHYQTLFRVVRYPIAVPASVVLAQVMAAVVAEWAAAGEVCPNIANGPVAWRQKLCMARCARFPQGCATGAVFVGCRLDRKSVGRQHCRKYFACHSQVVRHA